MDGTSALVVTGAVFGLIGGLVGCLWVRRAIGEPSALLAGGAIWLLIAVGWFFDLFGTALGVFAGVAAYAVARHRLDVVRSLFASGATYIVVTVGFTVLLSIALSGM